MNYKFKIMINIQFVFNGGLGNQIFQFLASQEISNKFKNKSINYALSNYIISGVRNFELNKLLIKPLKVNSKDSNINDENLKIIFSNGNSSTSENDEITVKLRTNNFQLIYDWYGVSLFNYSGSNFVNDKLQKRI